MKRKVKVEKVRWREKSELVNIKRKKSVWIVCLAPLCVKSVSKSSPILR